MSDPHYEPHPAGGTVLELPPLPLAQVRVANGLASLNDAERLAVLAWIVARTLVRAPKDPKLASVDFLADVWAKIDAIAAGAPRPAQE
jgi:hypothetical protein